MKPEEVAQIEAIVLEQLPRECTWTITSMHEYTPIIQPQGQWPHSWWLVRVRRVDGSSYGSHPYRGRGTTFLCERTIDGWACHFVRVLRTR